MANNKTNSLENLKSIGRQQISDEHTVVLDSTGSKIDNLEIANNEVNEIESKSIEQMHQNLLKVLKTFKFILEINPLRYDCSISQISKVFKFFHERKYPWR